LTLASSSPHSALISALLPVLISPNTAMSTRPDSSFSAMRPSSSMSLDRARSSTSLQPWQRAIAARIAPSDA
jgi:hypothetical protein